MDNRQVVFVMGAGHCGSTLLDLILGSHSECFSLGELFALPRFFDPKSDNYKHICSVCDSDCPIWHDQFSIKGFEHHFYRPKSGRRYPNANFYDYLSDYTGRSVLIDSSKNPNWIRHQWRLIHLSSKIKPRMIYLWRDGRAIVNSFLKKYPERGIARVSRHWKKRTHTMNELFEHLPYRAKMMVRYETLAESPEKTIRKICDFLGLDFEHEMLRYWQFDHHPIGGNLGTRSLIFRYHNKFDQVFVDRRKKINKSKTYWDYYQQIGLAIQPDYRWKEELTETQLAEFDAIAGEENKIEITQLSSHVSRGFQESLVKHRERKKNFKITVLMSVYNGATHLREAINSVLTQTISNFEFLIIDDGSSDNSLEIIEGYDDSRIRVIKNRDNIGLTRSLNKGLKLARGEYIARIDCDDICLPSRLERQLEFMSQNPEIGVCGSWVIVMKESGEYLRKFPVSHDEIQCFMLFKTPLAHPSGMIRKQVLTRNQLKYDPYFKYGQDMDLWDKCAMVCQMHNIDEPLIKYREHANQVGKKHRGEQKFFSNSVRKNILKRSGLLKSSQVEEAHQYLCISSKINRESLDRLQFWLSQLKSSNDKQKFYPEPIFSQVLSWRFFYECKKASFLGINSFFKFQNSDFKYFTDYIDTRERFKHLLACGKGSLKNKISF